MLVRSPLNRMAAAVFVVCAPTSSVSAAEFFIDNGDVPGLIAAINVANGNGEANIIHLATDGTYTLTAVHNDGPFTGPTGLPAVTSELIINGRGATLQRSSAPSTPAFRMMRLTFSAELTINDLTMANGNAGGSGGGAIRTGSFPGLTLNNCTFDNCSGSSGGAIYISEGNTTLNGCTIMWSFAGNDGGAVYNFDGNVALNDCTVSNCIASRGGAVFNAENLITITESEIADCSASNGGGGIYATSSVTIIDSTVIGNSGGSEGGGIRTTASFTAEGCLINGNSAGEGGGIRSSADFAALTLNNCTVTDNLAIGGIFSNGGGIHHDGITLIIDDTTISGNTANGWGGGIYKFGSEMNLTNCTIGGNSSAERGGGIANAGGTLTLTDTLITNNSVPPVSGSRGAGIYSIGNSSALTLIDSTVTGNSSARLGAGIYLSGGSLLATRTTISGNLSEYDGIGGGQGGGIRTENATVTITDTTISDNSAINPGATAGSGGGIINLSSNVSMTNSTVSGNTSTFGGGIRNNDATLSLTNCTISNNVGDPGSGGGIFTTAGDTSVVTLSNTIVAYSNSNAFAGDILGEYIDAGFNIIEDGVGVTHPTSMSGDPNLAPLVQNGGLTWTHALLPGSIAIETGDCAGDTITHDQRGVQRPQGKACDIGAFELETQPTSCPGDLTNSGEVNVDDLLIVLNNWGSCPGGEPGCPGDATGNGEVNVDDLLIVLNNWGPCP